jgi:hypothetical protein
MIMTHYDTDVRLRNATTLQRLEVDSITEKQPHMVVQDRGGNAHVVPMWLIRQVASGEHIADNDLSRVLAVALLDNINDR